MNKVTLLSFKEFAELARLGPLVGYLTTDRGAYLILSTGPDISTCYHTAEQQAYQIMIDDDARVTVPLI